MKLKSKAEKQFYIKLNKTISFFPLFFSTDALKYFLCRESSQHEQRTFDLREGEKTRVSITRRRSHSNLATFSEKRRIFVFDFPLDCVNCLCVQCDPKNISALAIEQCKSFFLWTTHRSPHSTSEESVSKSF